MRLAEGAARAGYRVQAFEALDSTNSVAMACARNGDPGRLWIVATEQTAGRGRLGRSWSSPPGNLYASLLLVDDVAPATAWQLGFVGGVALADALVLATGGVVQPTIKWPNDVLCQGAKLAGVLVEGTRLPDGRFALIAGFGVNCRSHPPGTPYPATSLSALVPHAPSAASVFEALTQGLPAALDLLADDFSCLRNAWLKRALRPGTRLTVSVPDGRREGSFRTIDDGGRLILDTAAGQLRLESGDVLAAKVPAAAG